MSLKIAARIDAIQAPIIPMIGAWSRENPGTISLGQGIVRYGPPPEILGRMKAFLDVPGAHVYQPDEGMPELVEALGAKLGAENGVSLGGREIVVTAGANMGFLNALFTIADAGDEIVVLAPYYFNHMMAIDLAGCKAVVVDTRDDYRPDVDAIRDALGPRTRAVVTVSPNNPTGVTYDEETLRAINGLCAEREVYHINDEAYEYFTYEGANHFSPASIPGSERHTIALYSLSKSYGFASWRVGYMVQAEELLEPALKVQDTNVICAPAISQYAALACLERGRAYCAPEVAALDRVRRLVVDELRELGDLVHVPRTDGAFFVYLKVNTDRDDVELVHDLIARHGVAVVPGSTFGSSGCYLRVSYGALDEATVSTGIGRLKQGLRDLVG